MALPGDQYRHQWRIAHAQWATSARAHGDNRARSLRDAATTTALPGTFSGGMYHKAAPHCMLFINKCNGTAHEPMGNN